MKKRQVFLVEPMGRGGFAHYTFCLAEALAAEELDVALYTANEYELQPSGRFSVFEVFNIRRPRPTKLSSRLVQPLLKVPSTISGVLALRRAVRARRPDIVHFQGGSVRSADWLFSRFLWTLIKKTGGKVVYTAHNVLPHNRGRLDKPIYRYIFTRADLIILHAEANRGALKSTAPGHAPVSVIPHGHYAFFKQGTSGSKEEAKARLGLNVDDPVVLFFGLIQPYKGLDDLINACRTLRRRFRPLKLLIVGKPHNGFNKYEGLINEHGLSDMVIKSLNYVEINKVAMYFRAADVAALPYKETYQSGVAHIALAFGLPVVGSKTGGLPEIIETAECGLVYEPGDVEALTKALSSVLNDADLARRLGENGRHFADTVCAWPIVARKTIAAYFGGTLVSYVD